MQNGSRQQGHVRYPCTMQINATSKKWRKEGKPQGKNPPPKRGKQHAKKKHEVKEGRPQLIPPRTTSITPSIGYN